jgi:integrase/recombinase XerD
VNSGVSGLIAAAGPEVTETYIDFFTATIRNRNTRQAYARACWQFFDWCAAHGLELTTVRPFHVAAWIEDFPGSKPTVKLKLAAVRMLYDFLVVRQITPSPGGRPASRFIWKTTDASSTPSRWPGMNLRGQPNFTIGRRTKLH